MAKIITHQEAGYKMKRSNLTNTLKKLAELNRQLDDIADVLKQDGMTYHIERAENYLGTVRVYLECAILNLEEYKDSKQLEDNVTEYSIERGNLASKLNSIYGVT